MTSSKLKTAQALATIFATVAVPILVAVMGWQIQKAISAESVKKDYVQMAVNILSRPDDGKDGDIRDWAVKVLNANSPVPMPPNVQSNLSSGTFFAGPRLVGMLLDTPMMDPPKELLPLPPDDKTVGDLLRNNQENMYRCHHNLLTLSALQKLIKEFAAIESRPSPSKGPIGDSESGT